MPRLRRERRELGRQVLHILFGIATIGVILFLRSVQDWEQALVLAQLCFFAVLCAALSIAHLRLLKISTPFDFLFEYVGKRDRFPGEGAIWYLVGILLVLTFLQKFHAILAAILILAIGDSTSTIFAQRKMKGFLFKNKTPESIVAFILLSLPLTILLIGNSAIPLVLLCALIEAVDLKINDNFLIPAACVAFFLLT